MIEGTVKFFDSEKHFGFINGDDGKSYYFHATQVERDTHVTDGDKVSFTPSQGERGPKAEKVAKITNARKAAVEEDAEVAEPAESSGETKSDDGDDDDEDGDSEDDEEEKIGDDEGSPE